MEVILDAQFHTDGDFHFEDGNNLIDPNRDFYKNWKIKYDHDHSGETEYFYLRAVGSDSCPFPLRDLLESMMCNLRVSKSHYWLIRDIYNILDEILNICVYERDNSEDSVSVTKYLSGNYDGTTISAIVVNDQVTPKRRKDDIIREYQNLLRDNSMVEVRPGCWEYANQFKRNQLREEYRSTLSNMEQLAVFLHEHLCSANHTDGCGWYYEIDGIADNWLGWVHKKYLDMAKRIMEECSDIETIKSIILAMKQ